MVDLIWTIMQLQLAGVKLEVPQGQSCISQTRLWSKPAYTQPRAHAGTQGVIQAFCLHTKPPDSLQGTATERIACQGC
jgi:hypothetical protein